MKLPSVDGAVPFPPLARALAEPNGLLAFGGDLSVPRLVDAYRRGIFPWYSEGQPILWWSPDPRMVLDPARFAPSRSLRRRIAAGTFEIRVDTAFDDVVAGCAAPRPGAGGTWIIPAMRRAYGALHRAGHAHSVEAWRAGELVGGLYGVALDRMFFGESMFARETDASKVALAHLCATCVARGIALIDCQQETAHLASLGAAPMPRREFAARLAELIHSTAPQHDWAARAP
ncbi:MAG: leucyl/phenylalanyl-tRNA--protein transferase [Proteobacteria bacterium]|nr:leucyl/phenylalanyl-tRNA--protein transferase [Pseudomonadota bacterium]